MSRTIIVSVNDVFIADINKALDSVQMDVVQEVELGTIPGEVLPGTLRSLFSGVHNAAPPEEDTAALASPVAAATKEVEALYKAVQAEELAAASESEACGVPEATLLAVGSHFSNMEVAEHAVRLHCHTSLRMLGGTRKTGEQGYVKVLLFIAPRSLPGGATDRL